MIRMSTKAAFVLAAMHFGGALFVLWYFRHSHFYGPVMLDFCTFCVATLVWVGIAIKSVKEDLRDSQETKIRTATRA